MRRIRAARYRAGFLLLVWSSLLQFLPYQARAQYPLATPRSEPLGPSGTRQGWTIQPTLAVEETYTDNVALAPKGAERSDWITDVRPALTVTGTGPRLRLHLEYAPQLIYRAREESRDIYHYLRGNGTAEIVNDLLFVDAQAYMSRQNVSLLGPQAVSDVNVTGNRTSVRGYSVSPYLRRNFGYSARGELRYSRSEVAYGGNSLFNSEGDRVDATLASGPAYRLLTWNVAYVRDHIRYTETNQTIDLERVSAGARRLITPTIGVLANVGYEDNSYVTLGPSPKGKFWSVGPEWAPTPRTRLAATTGRRFFGPTHTVDFSHRTRLTTWNVNYSEDITTGRGQVLLPASFDTSTYLDALFLPGIPDAAARRTAVEGVISRSGLPATLTAPVNYVTTVPFVQKRLQASFAINGVKNSVFANAYRQTRDVNAADAVINQAGAGDLSLSPRTVQTGGGVLWSHRITPLTTTNVSVDIARNEFPAIAREDKISLVRVALVKQFQPRLSGSLAFRRVQNHSNAGGVDYRENAVIAGISVRF